MAQLGEGRVHGNVSRTREKIVQYVTERGSALGVTGRKKSYGWRRSGDVEGRRHRALAIREWVGEAGAQVGGTG